MQSCSMCLCVVLGTSRGAWHGQREPAARAWENGTGRDHTGVCREGV